MAHPDPKRSGSEHDQRRHVKPNTEASDLGRQDKAQSRPGTHAAERRSDNIGSAPESGEKPEVRTPDGPARR